MPKKSISLEHAGPITHLDIPLPDEGGIVCLKASHGLGKSHALSAVQSYLSGEGKVAIQDQAEKAEVNGLGIRMVVKKTTGSRRHGKLEVESLEGKFDLGDLLDPGTKDEKVADAKRIKALISISGIKAEESLFYPLFANHDEFKQVVQVVSTEAPDLIEMAARIKRDIEAAARQQELLFEEKKAEATGLNSSIPHEIVEMELPDLASLEADLKTAQNEASEIRAIRTTAVQLHEQHKTYSDELSKISLADLSEIMLRGKNLAVEFAELESKKIAMEKSLDDLKQTMSSVAAKRDAARSEYIKTKNESDRVEHLKESLAESLPAIPTDDQIQSADLNVQVICKHIEAVKQKDKLLETAGKVRRLITDSEQCQLMGQRYRKAALSVDQVLSNIISSSGGPLRVDNGRLVLNTDRGIEKFSDLSHGEKAKIGIDLQIGAIGPNGFMVLNQEVFEGLNDPTRKEIADYARQKKVTILTAECSEDPQIKVEAI